MAATLAAAMTVPHRPYHSVFRTNNMLIFTRASACARSRNSSDVFMCVLGVWVSCACVDVLHSALRRRRRRRRQGAVEELFTVKVLRNTYTDDVVVLGGGGVGKPAYKYIRSTWCKHARARVCVYLRRNDDARIFARTKSHA